MWKAPVNVTNTEFAAGQQKTEEKWTMNWWPDTYVSQHHANKNKPAVDVSAPVNHLDEKQAIARYGQFRRAGSFMDLSYLIGAPEVVPYTSTHGNYELLYMGVMLVTAFKMNIFFARMASAAVNYNAAQNAIALKLIGNLMFVRTIMASTIGIGGYLFAYEYLYTHGPAFLALKDPHPNMQRQAWREDNTTYGARAVASIFPAIGYAFYKGNTKRFAFALAQTVGWSTFYEFGRVNIIPGMRNAIMAHSRVEAEREAAVFGSLVPATMHRTDADTGYLETAHQHRFIRFATDLQVDTIWENALPENIPMSRGAKVPNPWFNWQKAPRHRNDELFKAKNDLWRLPCTLDSLMRSGALDAR